jgi:hypothetical protein
MYDRPLSSRPMRTAGCRRSPHRRRGSIRFLDRHMAGRR